MRKIIPFLILCSIATCNAELRTWTAVNGKEVEAEFVSNSDGLVSLKMKTGKVFKVPLNSLSKEDQNFLKVKTSSKESTNDVPINANLKYQIKGDAVTIIGCEKQISGSLIIPEKINGKPVRKIGFGALANCVKVESITISKSVTQIEIYAFQNCMSLFDITIPDNVISIGSSAFSGCWKLEKITIGKGVKKIGDRAFNARGLKEVTFLGDAPEVGETPFNGVTVIYRKPEAKGWKNTLSGRPVKLISENSVKVRPEKVNPKPKVVRGRTYKNRDKLLTTNKKELEYLWRSEGKTPNIRRYRIFHMKGSEIPYTGKIFGLLYRGGGQKRSEGNVKDGKQDGPFVAWHENGQKSYEANFKDGKQDGLYMEWHENGQKEAEYTYKDGKPDGLGVEWHENGQKKKEVNFKDGKAVEGSEKLWDNKGEPK